jgi:hypothetical protein
MNCATGKQQRSNNSFEAAEKDSEKAQVISALKSC